MMAVSASWDDSADDVMSFQDSDQFEEDSLCSLGSDNESVGTLTWRGWRKSGTGSLASPVDFTASPSLLENVRALTEIAAEVVAANYAFEAVEQYKPPVPEQLQLRIAFYAFPKHEDDIRLYSCLANGSMSEFQKGEQFVKHKSVKNVLQIGFHLSGMVTQPQSGGQQQGPHSVSVSFDRGKITSCWCTCQSSIVWCAHVTAVCLLRIQCPSQVSLRAPVSESLSRLGRDQLQKFAQYLINELPQQILPTAQKLLDELLSTEGSEINQLQGAPDPTAGASVGSITSWCLDDETLRVNIRKILGRFSGPVPVAFVDINNLCCTSGSPPAALEWTNLMRPLRKKDPEGLWNLLFIVSDLLKSYDPNSTRILEAFTDECLTMHQLVMWWLSSENEDILMNNGRGRHSSHRNGTLPSTDNAKHTSVRLLDEHVKLWKLVAMDPCLSPEDTQQLKTKLEMWHNNTVLIGQKGLGFDVASFQIVSERFKGFKPAIEACTVNWMEKYKLLGFCKDDFTERRKDKDIPARISSCTLIPAADLTEFTEQRAQTELDNLFSCAQALHAHGYRRAALSLSARLANILLKFLNNSSGELSTTVLNKLVSLPSKVAFITEILTEDPSYVPLAFQMALLGLTMPRGAAATKLQEVRLTDNEISLHSTLKAIPLSAAEVEIVKSKAQAILSGQLSRGTFVLPILFGLYAFEVLADAELEGIFLAKEKIMFVKENIVMNDEDKLLAYKVALHILDERSNASEKKHAMLCEGIRRRRSDLALTLLWHFRDHEDKIREILGTILSRERYDNVAFDRSIELRPEDHIRVEPTGNPVPCMSQPPLSISKSNPIDVEPSAGKSCTQTTSSDSSDSGNGGGGKEKGTCWRLQKLFGTSGSPVGPKRNVKGRYNKMAKGARYKRQYKRQRSREFTESDSDSQYSGRVATRSVSEVNDRQDWGVASLSSQSDGAVVDNSIDVGSSGSLGDTDSRTDTLAAASKDKSSSTEDKLFKNVTLGGKGDDGDNCPRGRENHSQSSISQTSDEDRLSLSSYHEETISDDGRQQNNDAVSMNQETTASQPCKDRTDDLSYNHTFGAQKQVKEIICASDPSFDSTSGDEDKGGGSFESRDNWFSFVPAHMVSSPSAGSSANNLYLADVSDHNVGVLLDEKASSYQNGKSWLKPEEEERSSLTLNQACSAPIMMRRLQISISEESDSLLEPSAGPSSIYSSSHLPDTAEQRDLTGKFETSQSGTEDKLGCPFSLNSQDATPCSSGSTSNISTSSIPKDTVTSGPRMGTKNDSTDDAKDLSAKNVLNSAPFTRSAQADAAKGDASTKKKKLRGSCRTRPLDVRHVAAESFMLFELAKRVLHKSYGQDMLCLIGPNDDVHHLSSRHRGLQLAAFEIGLFALGINNLVTPNWMSRTYSSNVSWVTNEAIELGTPALRLINEQWEGVLTPSEVIEIASRAARSAETMLTRTAAELSLSCLPQANSLTPREIEQAIVLCKDQDSEMLERACVSIESASRNGGVQPELLFQIARQWHYLQEKQREDEHGNHSASNSQRVFFSTPANRQQEEPGPDPINSVLTPRHPHTSLSVTMNRQSLSFVTPEQFVQEQMHQQAQEIITRQQFMRLNSYVRCDEGPPTWVYNSLGRSAYRSSIAPSVISRGLLPHSSRMQIPQPINYPTEMRAFDTPRYLQNAYRVGMKALEGLAARMPDERAEYKYAPSPPCSDDIRWLCALAASMGPAHLRQFCSIVVSAVSSPFLLHDLALESARHFALYNPAQLASHLRSPSVSPVVQKCLTIYTELVRHELVKLTQAGYDGFVELLRKTRSAFCMAPGGMAKFNDLLEMIRKAYPRKKELWQMIMVGLSRA